MAQIVVAVLGVLVAPISGFDHEGRMQKRLSTRSSGIVESVGSSGGSDSELKLGDAGNSLA
jgi:hypothetical protein